MPDHDLGWHASGIRDNRYCGTVGDFLKEKIEPSAALAIVSAYFTIYAFAALKEKLGNIDNLRFLFGEPRFVKTLDPERTDKKAFKIEDEGLQLVNRLAQKRVAQECAAWIEDKVEIRSIKQTNLLHGKMYHIGNQGVEQALLGSSNFTVRGLGLGENGNNIELNLEVADDRDRRALKSWFDDLWHDMTLVEDVKEEVLLYLRQLYQNHAPEFIYYKTLFHLFEQYLEDQRESGLLSERSHLLDSQIWQALFEFQKDGVKGAINKILKHNGCIIADSVGLGKTFEALAVIKYFELLNYRVLVLCPKKLRENWTIYQAHVNDVLNPFPQDRFGYTVLSHTDLSRDTGYTGDVNLENFNWGSYDLVVIDESHNFRNDTKGRRDEEGNVIRRSRYERLMEDIIRSGARTRVLMLSATPVNNNLRDLRNQIYFMTGGRDDAFRESLGIGSLRDIMANAQSIFTAWAKRSTARHTRELLDRLDAAFFKLLDELTIARSRRHIETYYAAAIEQLGGFPVRLSPVPVYAPIDLGDLFMSYDTLNEQISKYQLSLFNPSKYVLPEYREQYEGTGKVRYFTQADREHYLIGMMKVNFLKRLESSIRSFAITMQRTITKIETLQDRLRQFKEFRAANPEVDFDDLTLDQEEDEELHAAFRVGKKLTFQMAHLDVDAWLADLNHDRRQLHQIYLAADDVSVERDAKLAELKRLIAQKVTQPTTDKQGQPNRKVLVFTAFADTAAYLYDALREWAVHELQIHLALVTGGSGGTKTTFGDNKFNHILMNFSPIAKQRRRVATMPQAGEIDLLIATDCISEGQNLQDCDYLVNYDIHWNPVRIIQRFGRIDRIGSINPSVQLVNFWPTPDLNKYIKLKSRVEARMALVDIAATLDDNLLAPAEIEELIAQGLTYRDKQLMRLRDEILEMEDFSESVALNEFTLDDFRVDLANYIASNRQKLQEAPLGLYAVVPAPADDPVIVPGVIYCLKQRGDTRGNERVNPLQPYFLVYVRDDQAVRFSFTHPKQILEMFRQLSVGQTTPYTELCNLFDLQTENGTDLSKYDTLLQRARKAITQTFRKRALRHLQSGRDAVLIEQHKQVRATTDFELITWLVISKVDS